jgi:simple sugar transport system ATP-binding protein
VVDPDAIVGELSVGLQQRVEILKALVRGAAILVLDEPTAVLTPAEADQLFEMLRVLKRENKTIIFITHKLREIMNLTDRVSVMRRGEIVATFDTARTSPPELADAMVGRKVTKDRKRPGAPGVGPLEARNLVVRDDRGVAHDDVSFLLREGEFWRSRRSRQRSVRASRRLRASALSSGEILIEGVPSPAQKRNPHMERLLGVGHVPEDRHRVGLVMPFEACESAMLGFHREPVYGKGFFYDRSAIVSDAEKKMDAFDVRPRAPLLKTANFSGGNQQKIVLAREIERNPKICSSGSRPGVDIGAIEFIHKRIVAQRDAGKAVLLVSVELDEIFALSDRIIVLCGGRITGERRPEETNTQDLGLLMAGVSERAA